MEACDGVELQPGQIFSYNDTLGPRTEERGYREATVIVGGEHAQDIGGGICQISTTLFMACLQSDPVSYTHLDVYKRQTLHRPFPEPVLPILTLKKK